MYIQNKKKNKYQTTVPQRGFTLLLASLIASLLLAVGLSMFTIAQKEIILSSLGRDSQYAFYAADAGAECALYWDFKDAFNTETATHGAKCNGYTIGEYHPPASATTEDLILGGIDYVGGVAVTEFFFEQNNKCINVSVTKHETGSIHTEINSRGYSVECDVNGDPITNSRTLERAVRTRY
jgi:Tfp pilus assembly protein PilX